MIRKQSKYIQHNRPEYLIPSKVKGYQFPIENYNIQPNDAILHALSIGINQNPLNQQQLKYTYENHQQFTVFPTFITIVNKFTPMITIFKCPYMPKPQNPRTLLTQTRVEYLNEQIKTNSKYLSKTKCIEIIINKEKKSIQTVFKIQTFLKNNSKPLFVVFNKIALPGITINEQDQQQIQKQNENIQKLPKMQSKSLQYKHCLRKQFFISGSQPIFYRLNRVTNNVHIDPKQSRKMKLRRPILHGQALIDYSIKQIVINCLKGKTNNLRSYHAKILKIAYSGLFSLLVYRRQNLYWFELRQISQSLQNNFESVQNIKPIKASQNNKNSIIIIGTVQQRNLPKI